MSKTSMLLKWKHGTSDSLIIKVSWNKQSKNQTSLAIMLVHSVLSLAQNQRVSVKESQKASDGGYEYVTFVYLVHFLSNTRWHYKSSYQPISTWNILSPTKNETNDLNRTSLNTIDHHQRNNEMYHQNATIQGYNPPNLQLFDC